MGDLGCFMLPLFSSFSLCCFLSSPLLTFEEVWAQVKAIFDLCLNLGSGLLGPMEGILIAVLHFFLGYFAWALFSYCFCPCPLHKISPDIFMVLSQILIFIYLCLVKSLFGLDSLFFLSHLSISSHLHPIFLCLAHGCMVRWWLPCLFGSPLPFILFFKE